MKKIFIVILVLILLISGGFFFFLKTRVPKEYTIEELLPEKPLVYLHASNISANWQKFSTTKLWQGLTAVDYKQLLTKSGATPQEMHTVEEFQKQFSLPAVKDFLGKFFGHEIALVIYPTEFDNLSSQAFMNAASNIFLVTRLEPQAQFSEFLTGVLNPFNKQMTTQRVPYRGYTIQVMKSADGTNIGYVRIKDMLVVGLGETAARRVLDTIAKGGKSLGKDPAYLQTKTYFIPSADAVGYINFDLFNVVMKEQIGKFAAKNGASAQTLQAQFAEGFKQLQGFKAIAYSKKYDDPIQVKFDLLYDKAALHPDVRPIYDCPPQPNATVSLVPAGVIGYQWSGCYNFKFYWEQWQRELKRLTENPKSVASPGEIVASIESMMGLSIEDDILPVLGDEAGGFLTDVNIQGDFPLPGLVMFVKVTSEEGAQKVIAALLEKQPLITLRSEDYQKKTIQYVPMSVAEGLTPSYCFINNYLFVATKKENLKQLIDVTQNPTAALPSDKSFQEMNFGLSEKNNSIFFARLDVLFAKLQELIDWSRQFSVKQVSQQEAFIKGSQDRLAEIRASIKKQEADLAQMKANPLPETPSAVVSPEAATGVPTLPGPTAAELERQIAETERIIAAAKDKEKEMEAMLQAMAGQKPASTSSSENQFLQELVKPVLKALEAMKSLSGRVTIGENLLETIIYLKIE